jgi:hypothetical protein
MIQNKLYSLLRDGLLSIRLLSICLFLIVQLSFAQKKDENIGTEVVNVVKPYSPTVSDANKIKEVPTVDDEETAKKQDIKYQIFSYPVASTFTPSKGRAAGVDKVKPEKLFSNYATLGFGNYSTINAELFVTHELDKYQYLGGMLRHHSSQGGVKGAQLDDKFSQTGLDVFYGYQRKDTKWVADLGYKYDTYNWYGVPLENPIFNKNLIKDVDPKHQFNTAKFGSELTLFDSFLDQLNVDFVGFWDSYNSKENRFIIKPSFNFNYGDTAVKVKFGVDYLTTNFDTSFNTQLPQNGADFKIQKSNLIVNVNPSFQLLKNDLALELGADLVYFAELKDVYAGITAEAGNKFLFYPKAIVSYKVFKDLVIAFGGVEGKLTQNSYADFTSQNKFLSPTLNLQPTNHNLIITAGIRGKLASGFAYNLKTSYDSSKNMALFKANPFLESPLYNYGIGNSFGVVYDDVRTILFCGELKADVNKNITLGLNAEVNKYTTNFQKEAWNLPTAKATFTSDFKIGKKWYAGTQLFYVGERKDEFTAVNFSNNSVLQTLEAYFDINANIGYKYNDRFTIFLKGSNLANQNYNRWLNYPVQGVQVLLGASYKFDF